MADYDFNDVVCRFYQGDITWHDGPGWYYVDDEYPDEGSCGAFSTLDEAIAHAREATYTFGLRPGGESIRLAPVPVDDTEVSGG